MASQNDDSEIPFSRIADDPVSIKHFFSETVFNKFEVYSYRNAAAILAGSFPEQFAAIVTALEAFSISETMIRSPGGSKGPIAKYVDTLFGSDWTETRITADLHVKLMDANKHDVILSEYTRSRFLDGHRIDFVNGRVALDLEWNSKDQTYDRDLYAFSAFYEAGAIDIGVILTRGSSLDTTFFSWSWQSFKKGWNRRK